MNYIDLINQFWTKDLEHHFSEKETALYFYLLNTCNSVRWRNPFGLSNQMTMARFGWGKTSFDCARNNLKCAGLIDFRPGIGRGNIYQYVIRGVGEDNTDQDRRESGKVTQPDAFSDHFYGKGHEKGDQIDIFPDHFCEKGAQPGTFSDHFYGKGHEKGTQTDTFSDHFYVLEDLKTEVFQKPLNNKHKYKLISKGKIYVSFPEKEKNEHQNLVNDPDLGKENGSAQKEKEVLERFHAVCGSFPKIVQVTCKRKEKILRRFAEMGGMQTLDLVFQKMEASDFLKGNNKTGWKATFDWVFDNPDNWVKILEGNYDNHITKPANDARFMGNLQTDLNKF